MTAPKYEKRWIRPAEVAKLARKALRNKFPDIKFSVRSESYSGGCAIRVSWLDGPTSDEVDAVTDQFRGSRFDGMIDYGYTVTHWLMPDGKATVAEDPGSMTTGGSNPASSTPRPNPAAELVTFGNLHVSLSRETSPDFRKRVFDGFVDKFGYKDLNWEPLYSGRITPDKWLDGHQAWARDVYGRELHATNANTPSACMAA